MEERSKGCPEVTTSDIGAQSHPSCTAVSEHRTTGEQDAEADRKRTGVIQTTSSASVTAVHPAPLGSPYSPRCNFPFLDHSDWKLSFPRFSYSSIRTWEGVSIVRDWKSTSSTHPKTMPILLDGVPNPLLFEFAIEGFPVFHGNWNGSYHQRRSITPCRWGIIPNRV